MDSPPETPQEPTSYDLHGDEIEDPYLWLEDDTETVSEWVDDQNAYAEAYLESVPVREVLREPFERYARTTDFGSIVARPSGYFQSIERSDDEQPVLTYRASLDDERDILLDPNEWSEDGTKSMGWWSVDPAGEKLAYAVDEGGAEQYDVYIIRVKDGEILDKLPDLGRAGPPAWTSDGIYYTRTGQAAAGEQLLKSVNFHRFGSDSSDDPQVLEVEDAGTWIAVAANRAGEHVLVQLIIGWERCELFYLEAGETELTPLLTDTDDMFHPLFAEDRLYLRTTHGADRYRVLQTDLGGTIEALEPTDLEEVIPEQSGLLEGVTVTDEYLITHCAEAAVSSLEVYDLDGGYVGKVPVPGPGAVSGLSGNRDEPEVFFVFESFDRPQTVYCFEPPASGSVVIDRTDLAVDVELTVDQQWFESADGTEIPMFVVHRADLDRTDPAPTLVYGYGGYEISLTPSFVRFGMEFLRAGGVFAQPNLRGGGEFGKQWHHAARGEHKQRTFDDMIAACEHLIEAGYTTPDHLAIQGGSNGGLTVGAVLTQRPELVRAVLCHVPLLDMLRFHRFLLGDSWTTEYGSPEDPTAYEWLSAYSPYHSLEERDYPAVLFKTAESDTRVHPVHAWKMTARLQELNTSEHPILCKTNRDTGHGTGKPTWMVIEEALDTWSFVFNELGIDSDQLTSRPN